MYHSEYWAFHWAFQPSGTRGGGGPDGGTKSAILRERDVDVDVEELRCGCRKEDFNARVDEDLCDCLHPILTLRL